MFFGCSFKIFLEIDTLDCIHHTNKSGKASYRGEEDICKGLISKKEKEFLQINKKKVYSSIGKWEKGLNGKSTKEDIQMIMST